MCLHPPFLIVHSLQTRIFFDMTMISIKIRKLTLRHDYHLILRTHSSVPVLLAMSFMAKGFISESHIAFSCVSLVYLSLEHFPSPSLTLLKIIGHLFCRMWPYLGSVWCFLKIRFRLYTFGKTFVFNVPKCLSFFLSFFDIRIITWLTQEGCYLNLNFYMTSSFITLISFLT